MAKGKKTGGRDFLPGQSGNPNGQPKVPQEIKDARQLTKLELERLLNKYMVMTKDEVQEALKNPATPALELMIGSIVAKAVSGGDDKRLNFLLERMIGKVKEKVEHTGADGQALALAPQIVITVPSNGRESDQN